MKAKSPFNLKEPKGTYGYLKSMHLYSILKACLFLGISLILYLCSRVFFPQHRGLFVVLAIISAVPAAMSIVSLVMYLRFNTGRREIFEETEALRGEAPVLYDCIVTTQQKSYGVNVFLTSNKNLIGYSEYKGMEINELTRHLEYMLKKNNYTGWNIKIFTDHDKYLERLRYISDKNLKILTADKNLAGFLKEIIL